jgi:hypothetical protein
MKFSDLTSVRKGCDNPSLNICVVTGLGAICVVTGLVSWRMVRQQA